MAGDLGSSPEWLALLRALGFESSAASSGAALQSSQVGAEQAYASPEIAYQGTVQRQGIDSSYEDRGLYSAGAHEQAIANQLHGEQFQQGALGLQTSGQLTDIQVQLAQRLAELQRQQAEGALTYGGALASTGY